MKIMYRAFLSHSQLKEYMKTLIENELLEYDSKSVIFRTTNKGMKFLSIYSQMDEVAPKQIVSY